MDESTCEASTITNVNGTHSEHALLEGYIVKHVILNSRELIAGSIHEPPDTFMAGFPLQAYGRSTGFDNDH